MAVPHAARKRSESGFYHVVPKGESNKIIFEDDEDRRRYLDLLAETKDVSGIKVRGYVLMSNHTHLVVDDESGKLSEAMKYLHERYAMYFKEKVGRAGRVFRKPLWSEPIESDEYLLAAVRYVDANPAVAGICPASAYEWSSARDYLGRNGVTDTDLVLDMLGGREGFIEFSRRDPMPLSAYPGSKLSRHITDDEALRVAKRALGETGLDALEGMPATKRNESVRDLLDAGLTINQVARITGLDRHIIQRGSGR